MIRIYHYKLALLGAVVFGFPGLNKNIKIIGVTGTSGKSTTVDFVTRIFDEANEKVASVSSIRFKVANKEWENKYKMTMPGRFVIQKLLSQAKKAGCKYVVLEVTSEGIRQFRHKFINFDCVVFTNLTPEHIESHGGFENYKKEKLKLFKENKNIHIINIDDKNSKEFLDIPAKQKIEFSIKDAENIKFDSNLISGFNIYNALSAISVARVYGISLDVCKKALEKIKVIPGRMEVVLEFPIKVIVDYAHTPDQLEAVYKTFSAKGGSAFGGSLVCVLGSCGGGRDKWKRPVLGEIAKKYCKEIIITNEDPYDEDPLSIMKEIESALLYDGANSKHHMILDRKEAIEKAIKLAKPGDVVIITGKGSEPWMCLENGRKIPWNDKQIAQDAVKKFFTP
ncbi:MAG: Mur ligase family protein [Candidatus Staskawiczbacteria bacterium]